MVGTLSVYEIEYVNPCNGKNMPVMLRTDYDEEVVKLLDAIGPKPCPPIWVTSLRKTGVQFHSGGKGAMNRAADLPRWKRGLLLNRAAR